MFQKLQGYKKNQDKNLKPKISKNPKLNKKFNKPKF